MCGNVVERVECIGITSFSVLPFVCLFILFTLLSGGLSPSVDVQGDWSIYYDCFCLTLYFCFLELSTPMGDRGSCQWGQCPCGGGSLDVCSGCVCSPVWFNSLRQV